MTSTNHQFRLAARPNGMPDRSNWDYTEEPVPEPGDGEVAVEVQYISLDPAMRGWMNEGRSYVPPVGIGEVMRAIGVGQVIATKNPDFAEGDHVTGLFGVQEYAVLDGSGLTKLDPELAPLSGAQDLAENTHAGPILPAEVCLPTRQRSSSPPSISNSFLRTA